jgi:hypothetical protein
VGVYNLQLKEHIMSIRARRINKIEHKKVPTFVLGDEVVSHWLEKNTGFFDTLDIVACGIAYLDVDDIKTMLDEIKIEEEVREAFEEDIEFAIENNQQYIQYYCF